jgi:thiol-disulfide isomerase/thioredoxin/tetratricopeptide (TPR) repeat protein
MKKTFLLTFCLAVITADSLVVGPVFAGELGQAAAPLKIAEWIKGKPVDLAADKGREVIVIEFWATWCGPCRQSIPHLTELQKKFQNQGVTFLGISDEAVDTVKTFVEKMGDKMDYTVAVEKGHDTSENYLGAFGVNGIPHAFVVDQQGRIVWHGHPMGELESTLAAVLAGKFDLGTEKKKELARAKVAAFMQAAQAGDEGKAQALGRELEKLDEEIGGLQPGKKFDTQEALKLAKFTTAVRRYQVAVATGKPDTELQKLEAAIKENAPKEFEFDELKHSLLLHKAAADYFSAAAGQGDATKLPELGRRLEEIKTKDHALLNELAWAILTDEHLQTRDYELAARLAKTSVELSKEKVPAPLDTYARALFDSGRVAEAIAWQKKAVAVADDGDQKNALEATLKRYQDTLAKK